MNSSITVDINWKSILAVGGAICMVIFTCKMDSNAAQQILANALNVFENCCCENAA